MMNRKEIVVFTKVLLDVMFYSGILVTASLPFTLKLAGKYYSQDFAEHYIPMLAVFLVSGVLRACDRVSAEEDDPHGHCKGLFCGRKYEEPEADGKTAFVIAAVYIVKVFTVPTPATFVIILTFFIAGCSVMF